MRFEELVYSVDGRPVTVQFHSRLTVVEVPGVDERGAWIARLLGVFEGLPCGDGATVVSVDGVGRRIRLERDDGGGATLTDLATEAELPYRAGHLSLDGRFDWFASVGLPSRSARDLMVVDAAALVGDVDDIVEVQAELKEMRELLARVEGQRQAAVTRWREVEDLRRRIADLDEQIHRPPQAPAVLETLLGACRAAAERRDELVARLDAQDDDALRRELVEEVEPVYAEALAGLADACGPFGVSITAVRLEATGIDAAGIEALGAEVLAEVAARAAAAVSLVTERSELHQQLDQAEREAPDVARLTDRHAALQRQVALLEASLSADSRRRTFGEGEKVLRKRAAAARRVGRQGEPLPLVVNDALAVFPASDKGRLLDALRRLGETTQIVYLTDDPDTLAWAADQAATGEIDLWPVVQPRSLA